MLLPTDSSVNGLLWLYKNLLFSATDRGSIDTLCPPLLFTDDLKQKKHKSRRMEHQWWKSNVEMDWLHHEEILKCCLVTILGTNESFFASIVASAKCWSTDLFLGGGQLVNPDCLHLAADASPSQCEEIYGCLIDKTDQIWLSGLHPWTMCSQDNDLGNGRPMLGTPWLSFNQYHSLRFWIYWKEFMMQMVLRSLVLPDWWRPERNYWAFFWLRQSVPPFRRAGL